MRILRVDGGSHGVVAQRHRMWKPASVPVVVIIIVILARVYPSVEIALRIGK